MDTRPLTPRERIEARREEREFRRSAIKHYPYRNIWRQWAVDANYLTWVKVFCVTEHLKSLAQLLKVLALAPKFCNGLIGVSLTDNLTALTSN
ncbi:hypothetical protein [Microcoleus sp. BROC3]|uniref:hypothetical protein n=1 Tax=Microcoleus sp. BROC3 TaxID=3055323 RepID=UPI002FD3A79E